MGRQHNGAYNFDQGGMTITPTGGTSPSDDYVMPGIVGQVRSSIDSLGNFPPQTDGPIPHFIRLFGPSISGLNYYHDFGINGGFGSSGLVTCNAPVVLFERIYAYFTTMWGLHNFTAVSYFNTYRQIYVSMQSISVSDYMVT